MSSPVVIVVPRYKPDLSYEEHTSLRHLRHHLSNYPRCWVSPNSLSITQDEFKVVYFGDWYFTNTSSYSKLLLSREFFAKFLEYEYILIHQLDCLVFSDQIAHFLKQGYDYIGAPWFSDPLDPQKGFSRVGNGGLSLRKVRSHLQVLESRWIPPWNVALSTRLPDLNGQTFPQRLYKQLKVIHAARHGVDWYTSHYSLNEDHFWSDRARLFWPDFKIAPVSAGLKFSFERYPRYCFERNRRQLPFGCHAWAKWDREFWEPFLIN